MEPFGIINLENSLINSELLFHENCNGVKGATMAMLTVMVALQRGGKQLSLAN